jgi:hypothetical protein
LAISRLARRNKEILQTNHLPIWWGKAGRKSTKDIIVDFVNAQQNGATGKEIHNSLPGLSQRTIQQNCKELLISERLDSIPCRCGLVHIFIRK